MADPVTSTDRGRVRGYETAHGYAFRGVPFAQPPFGALRFRAPEVPDHWSSERPALDSAPTAPQPPSGFTLIPEPRIEGGDAPDCLSLNVFTPDLGAAALPVLVWIHGGGFTTGTPSSTWYDGDRFARDGVVVVSAGYRLGAEGFLNIPGAPANRGVLDWLAALEWVQRNIAFFGGDPHRVTVGGQSAGGIATTLLATLPRASGLFRAAISMSGSVFPAQSRAATFRLTQEIATALQIRPTLSDFERIAPGALIAAQSAVTSNRRGVLADRLGTELTFFPFADGDVVVRSPMDAIAAGSGSALPFLIGATQEEFNATTRFPTIDEEAATKRLTGLGLDQAGIAAYRSDGRPPAEQVGQALTDRMFRVPALRVAEARQTAAAPTYHYEFQWRSPALGGLGAVHCLDIPFVFDVLDDRHARLVAGDRAPQVLADRMHAAWVSFVTDNDAGWTPFSVGSRPTMVFDEPTTVLDDLHSTIRNHWP